MKFKYIQLFVISFIVGMIFVYLSPVEYKTIVVYPTLNNLKKVQYKDTTNNCFNFTARLVDCTKKAKVISVQ